MGKFNGKDSGSNSSQSINLSDRSSESDYFIIDSGEGEARSASGLSSKLSSLGKTFQDILVIVLGICALVSLVGAIVTFMQGDQSGAKRLMLWLLGFVVGATVLGIISGISAGSSKGVIKEFGLITAEVRGVLISLLSIVSMVSAVTSAYHVMKGERDGVEKFLRTLIVCSLGITLLNLI